MDKKPRLNPEDVNDIFDIMNFLHENYDSLIPDPFVDVMEDYIKLKEVVEYLNDKVDEIKYRFYYMGFFERLKWKSKYKEREAKNHGCEVNEDGTLHVKKVMMFKDITDFQMMKLFKYFFKRRRRRRGRRPDKELEEHLYLWFNEFREQHLKDQLQEAIEAEDYEYCAEIQREIGKVVNLN